MPLAKKIAFRRRKEKTFRELLGNKKSQVILIEGPRQVGKTTLAVQVLQQSKRRYLSLNLEKDLRNLASLERCQDFQEFTEWLKDEFDFTPDGSQVLFIDEAQESRVLGRFVRFMKEDWSGVTTILTGSMMSRLFHHDIRYPVGRVTMLNIQSFSFFEYLDAYGKKEWLSLLEKSISSISILRHEKILAEFNRYLKVGGLPQVLKDFLAGGKFENTLREIFEQYRQDFMRVYGQDQGHLFEKALMGVIDHVGSPSKMTQALPLNDNNYKKMAEIYARLESWHMVYASPQRGPQPEGTTTFHPKRYLFDLGLLCQLRTLGVPDFDVLNTMEPAHRGILGGVFENMAALCLVALDIPLVGFKKDAAGMEVDFIAKFSGRAIPIECKASLKTKETHLSGIKIYMREYGLKLGIVVNAAPFEVKKYDFGKIISIPIYALEALPEILKKHGE